ncbi:MAG: GTP-binding protein [Oscillospiraceae bacterium]|nr:GTP-binding protein [Oscillospiraceae bacterium]
MTKIDIISGFLGAGKTTLIKKLLAEAYQGEKLVLIENEFGEISIDGGFLKEAGVQISEMSSGCICCSLVGNFTQALKDVYEQFHPDRILIEPSGVGKLSDVVAAVARTIEDVPELKLNSYVAVADAARVHVYMKNFGEFYNDQIETAGTIILSRTQKLTQEKLEKAVAMLREKNPNAAILTTPWDQLDGKTILSAVERESMAEALMEDLRHHHRHHDHDEECDDPNCSCHHHHHDEDEEHEHHHHHHHDHDEECDDPDCGCHHHHDHDEDDEHGHHHHHHHHDEDEEHVHHHHDHDEACACGCHDHDHDHHHHHADEVFGSWGVETPKVFTAEQLHTVLDELDSGEYGIVLRSKGIVPGGDGQWLHFDYVPGECEVRTGAADYTGRICVIGSGLKEDKLAALFGV